MSWLSCEADITPWIVIHYHANMELTLIILFDGFDDCRLVGECEIHNVAARFRLNADPATNSYLSASHAQVLDASFFFEKLPIPFVHHASPLSGRNSRSVL